MWDACGDDACRDQVDEQIKKLNDTTASARKAMAMCILDFDALANTGIVNDQQQHNRLRINVDMDEVDIIPDRCPEAERLRELLLERGLPAEALDKCLDEDGEVCLRRVHLDAHSLVKLGLDEGKLEDKEKFDFASPHVKVLRKMLQAVFTQDVIDEGWGYPLNADVLGDRSPFDKRELEELEKEHKRVCP